MQLDPVAYVFDMREACRKFRQFTTGKSFRDYVDDELLQSAVERQFEILGEAMGQLHKVVPDLTSQIKDHRRIIDFRNLLIHGYAMVSHAVVWGIVETRLPSLCAELDTLWTLIAHEIGE